MIDQFKRPMAKVITAGNIAQMMVHAMARIALEGKEPTAEVLAKLEPTRINIAEFVIKQLDAYDQRT